MSNNIDAVSYDLNRYHDEEADQERWLEQNLYDLTEEFFERYELTPDENPKLWERFVDLKWQGKLAQD